MASRKPLVINGGMIEQLQSGDSLDAATTGKDVAILEAAESLVLGDVVYISAAGVVSKSKADASATAKAIGLVADAAIESAASGAIQTDGILAGLTGLTAGSAYYLSADTAGLITPTPPSSAGDFVVRIGTAISTTELEISIRESIKL